MRDWYLINDEGECLDVFATAAEAAVEAQAYADNLHIGEHVDNVSVRYWTEEELQEFARQKYCSKYKVTT